MCISSDLSLSFHHFISSAVVLGSFSFLTVCLFLLSPFYFCLSLFIWFVSFVWVSVGPFFSVFLHICIFSVFCLCSPSLYRSIQPTTTPPPSLSPSHQSLHKLFWGRKQQKGEERWELEGQEFFGVKLSGSVMHENTLSDMITHQLFVSQYYYLFPCKVLV